MTASMLAVALVAACGGFSGGTEGPALPHAGDAALPVDAKALDTGLVVTDAGVDAAAECEQLQFASTFEESNGAKVSAYGWTEINDSQRLTDAGGLDAGMDADSAALDGGDGGSDAAPTFGRTAGGDLEVVDSDGGGRVLRIKGFDTARPWGHAVVAYRNFPASQRCIRLSVDVRADLLRGPNGNARIDVVKLAPSADATGITVAMVRRSPGSPTVNVTVTPQEGATQEIGEHALSLGTWLRVLLTVTRAGDDWRYAYEIKEPNIDVGRGETLVRGDQSVAPQARVSLGSVTLAETESRLFFDDVKVTSSANP